MEKNYGFDMNDEIITESTVESLYMIAENEILRNSDLCKSCYSATIDYDTFEYFATGTAFGADMSYEIYTTFNNDNIKDIYSTFYVNENGEYTTPSVRFDENNTFVINTRIIVKNNEISDVAIDDISVYRNNTYSEYDSIALDKNINRELFMKKIIEDTKCENLVRDIHVTLSNI